MRSKQKIDRRRFKVLGTKEPFAFVVVEKYPLVNRFRSKRGQQHTQARSLFAEIYENGFPKVDKQKVNLVERDEFATITQ
jgi:hypothetical protein